MTAPTKTTVEQHGEIAILRFEGDIMSASEEAVLGAYERVGVGTRKLLLDFSRVPYLNSSGIALVIRLLIAASKASQRTVCFGLSAHFEKVFRILGLARYTSLHVD
ncbi:MAG TPA: STAS domain-containing protein, partial [Bryobacteraceae bacterium]|nr:STAS domain-containing protein [Bryobacteraceae bacterium]